MPRLPRGNEMRSGIIHGMANSDYHAGPEISNTAISAACRSMQHYRHYKDHGSDIGAKTALDGHLVHCAILEPCEFDNRYIISPKFDMRTTFGKSGAAEFEEIANGRERITQDQYDMAMKSAENVRRSVFFMDFMQGGTPEVSIFWNDSECGLDCRCRPDLLNIGRKVVIDVKSTTDCRQFAKSVMQYSYHQQESFYRAGCREVGIEIERFFFLCIEKILPFAFQVFELEKALVDIGYDRWRKALNDISMAQFSGLYPGYSSDIQMIEKPSWA